MNKTTLDIRGDKIKCGDMVHFAHANSINYYAVDGPIVYAIDSRPYNVYYDESVAALRVDFSDHFMSVDHTEFFNHLDRMIDAGKAEIVKAPL